MTTKQVYIDVGIYRALKIEAAERDVPMGSIAGLACCIFMAKLSMNENTRSQCGEWLRDLGIDVDDGPVEPHAVQALLEEVHFTSH